jgi:hypothetical protein
MSSLGDEEIELKPESIDIVMGVIQDLMRGLNNQLKVIRADE